MKLCKHPIKKLSTTSITESDADGYGGTSYWEWYELRCDCGKSIKLNDKDSSNTSARVTEKAYREFTGRSVDLKEAQAVFTTNKSLYRDLEANGYVHDMVLRTKGDRTDTLEKQIEKKRKLIKKHKAELSKMLEKFHGGSVPFYERYRDM